MALALIGEEFPRILSGFCAVPPIAERIAPLKMAGQGPKAEFSCQVDSPCGMDRPMFKIGGGIGLC